MPLRMCFFASRFTHFRVCLNACPSWVIKSVSCFVSAEKCSALALVVARVLVRPPHAPLHLDIAAISAPSYRLRSLVAEQPRLAGISATMPPETLVSALDDARPAKKPRRQLSRRDTDAAVDKVVQEPQTCRPPQDPLFWLCGMS